MCFYSVIFATKTFYKYEVLSEQSVPTERKTSHVSCRGGWMGPRQRGASRGCVCRGATQLPIAARWSLKILKHYLIIWKLSFMLAYFYLPLLLCMFESSDHFKNNAEGFEFEKRYNVRFIKRAALVSRIASAPGFQSGSAAVRFVQGHRFYFIWGKNREQSAVFKRWKSLD